MTEMSTPKDLRARAEAKGEESKNPGQGMDIDDIDVAGKNVEQCT